MKRLIIGIVITMAVLPARAQFFKKLKEEASQRMKDKLDQKKSQKIDEQTEKASNKVMSVPDSVVQKTGRVLRKKRDSQKKEERADSTEIRPVPDTTAAKTPEQ